MYFCAIPISDWAYGQHRKRALFCQEHGSRRKSTKGLHPFSCYFIEHLLNRCWEADIALDCGDRFKTLKASRPARGDRHMIKYNIHDRCWTSASQTLICVRITWRAWLDGWIASLTPWTWVSANSGDNEGQGSLACCSPRGRKSQAQLSNWTTAKTHPWQFRNG